MKNALEEDRVIALKKRALKNNRRHPFASLEKGGGLNTTKEKKK